MMSGLLPAVEYRFSRTKLILCVVVGIPAVALLAVMTSTCMDSIDGMISGGPVSYLALAVASIITILLGLTTLSGVLLTARRAWHLLSARGPVVTLSPQGFRDHRLAAEVIPWSSITRIWKGRRSGQLLIAIEPSVERALTLTTIASILYIFNRLILIRGHCIWTQELERGPAPIYEACLAYSGQALIEQLKTRDMSRTHPVMRGP